MKIVIILIALLLLLGGGGFAAWTFFPDMVKPMLGIYPEGQEPPPPPAATGIVDIDPLIMPIFEDGTVRRFLVLELSFEVYQPNGNLIVQSQLPRLQNAFLTYILSLQAKGLNDKLTDPRFLKDRLMRVTADVMGPGVVHDILLKNVFERPVS